jgi:Ca2+-binding RTX toxin-like protein
MNDANFHAAETLTVDATALTGPHTLGFDGSGTTSSNFVFEFAGGFTAGDALTGGAGNDTLSLDGDYSTPTAILVANVQNIENLTLLGAANSYNIAVGDGISSTLTVDAGTAASLTFIATSDATTTFVVTGSAGNDTIAGGTLDDTITGGLGADALTGGGGADTFGYGSAADSNTATGYDAITDLTTANSIHVADGIPTYFGSFGVSSYQGSLDADLSSQLSGMSAGEYAAVFLVGGTDPLVGHLFLVIDGNNTAGYQPGADYVIDISGYSNDPALIHFI